MDKATLITNTSVEDTRSIDGIVTALYASISGPAGPRDWFRLRTLFMPRAPMGSAAPMAGLPTFGLEVMNVDEFVERLSPHFQAHDYHEHELSRRVERFGHIAHVFSTYEVRQAVEPRYARGINSLQLFWDGERWWIASMFWETERGAVVLPEVYLESTGVGAPRG